MKLTNVDMIVAATFLLASCGGGDSESLTAEESLNKFVTSFCERAIECKADAPAGFSYETEAECATAFGGLIGDNVEAIQASIDAGRISWDESDAAYCMDLSISQMNDLSCTEFWSDNNAAEPDDARCETLGDGLVADGGACTIDDDCAVNGSECVDSVCVGQ